MHVKEMYSLLFSQKWPDIDDFLYEVTLEDHPMWGAGGAGREFAKEILKYDERWRWLAFRIDDFAVLIEESMRKKLSNWIWRSQLGIGSLSKHSDSTESIASWIMNRYVSELKNLFDPRYKNSIDPKKISITNLINYSI